MGNLNALNNTNHILYISRRVKLGQEILFMLFCFNGYVSSLIPTYLFIWQIFFHLHPKYIVKGGLLTRACDFVIRVASGAVEKCSPSPELWVRLEWHLHNIQRESGREKNNYLHLQDLSKFYI